jgi:Lon-like ATP-dependent protease
MSDVFNVGTFAQIQEMQDLGDKLRLVVTAHRRVKITGQLIEELDEDSVKGMQSNNVFNLLNF